MDKMMVGSRVYMGPWDDKKLGTVVAVEPERKDIHGHYPVEVQWDSGICEKTISSQVILMQEDMDKVEEIVQQPGEEAIFCEQEAVLDEFFGDLLGSFAEAEGERLLQEYEQDLAEGNLPEMPEELDQRCRKIIAEYCNGTTFAERVGMEENL